MADVPRCCGDACGLAAVGCDGGSRGSSGCAMALLRWWHCCQEGSQGTQKGVPDFNLRGFAFCKPILYIRVEAHFNRSKIT